MKQHVCILFASLIAMPSLLLCYSPMIEWEKGHGSYIGNHSSIIVDDVDEDGEREIVIGNAEGFVHVLYESSPGIYVDEWKSQCLGSETNGIAIGDADGDGEKELLVGTYNGNLYVFGYDGSSFVQEWKSPYVTRNMWGIAVGDVDDDGLNEIVFAGWEGNVYVYEWNGATYVQKWQSSDLGTYVLDLTIGDTDEDGINEIIVGSGFSDMVYVFGWDGNTFQQEWVSLSLASQTYGVAVGDVDDDASPEIIATTLWGTVYVFSYVGPGNYIEDWASADVGNYLYTPAIGDVDGDTTIEFLVGTSDGFIQIFSYTGATYQIEHTIGTAGTYLCPSIGDCDNDSALEIVSGCTEAALFVYGYTDPGYSEEWLSDDLGRELFGVSGGDIDMDGENELIIGAAEAYTGFPLYVYEYDGMNYVQDWVGNLGPNAWSIDVGNLDEDTITEFAFGNQQNFAYIYSYDGAQYIEEWQSAFLNGDIYAVAIGDVDDDGIQELVAADVMGVLRVWGWDGAQYQLEYESSPNAVGMEIHGIRIADVKPGNVKEIIIASGIMGMLKVWYYTGATYQEDWSSPSLGSNLHGLDVADIDNDTTIEMVCGDGEGDIYVFAWDGGSYAQEWTTNIGNGAFGIAAGDVDADGTVEFVAAGSSGGSFTIFGYDGATYQIECAVDSFCPQMGRYNAIKVLDFDNDGLNELAAGASGYFFVFGFPDSTNPAVAVVSPNGGEMLMEGDTFDITWIASDYHRIDSVTIEYSTDNGGTWNPIASGEPNDSMYSWFVPGTQSDSCLVKIIAFDPSHNTDEDESDSLFSIVGLGIAKQGKNENQFFCHSYPEPANNSLSITYGIPRKTHVELMLFDVTGRQIKELVDEIQNQGTHTFHLENCDLCNGIYFYRLKTRSYTHFEKITIIK